MNEFLQRLRERKLVQWALAYVAAAFALIQALDIVAQRFGWPEQAVRFAIIALAIGFFVTLVLAWYHGERGAQRVTGIELLILALLLSIGGGFLWRIAASSNASEQPAPSIKAALITPGSTPSVRADDKSIAVLPFANLSHDPDNAFFADGMQDEILTKLSKIAALRVVSRTSTRHYVSAPENLAEIARQLGVANILEGSVQRAGNAVHINVQLIGAAKDEHLWAESYNRTLDDIFGVEGEVAQAVADQLKATLSGAERQVVASKGTENPKAYEAYLRGRSSDNSGYSFPGTIRAVDNYYIAVREDPNFARAWSAAAIAMSGLYQNGYDGERSTADAIGAAAGAAMKLQPELAESLLARGAYLYRVRRDFPAAREAYQQALARQPGDAEILGELFFVERRMGLWEEAVAHYREAIAVDPRNVSIRVQGACEVVFRLRRFDETRELLEQALKMAPDDSTARACLAQVEQRVGRLDAADVWLASVPANLGELFDADTRIQQFALRRNYDALAEFIRPAEQRADTALVGGDLIGLMRQAFAQHANGHDELARKTFERLDRVFAKAPGGIDHVTQIAAISPLVYAGLGDWARAIAAAKHQIEINRNDMVDGPAAKITLAQIYAQKGDRDAAIALLPELLEVPSGVTPALLALDPIWDSIRNDPRFVALTKQPLTEYKIPPHG